jgi:hypothetical protein
LKHGVHGFPFLELADDWFDGSCSRSVEVVLPPWPSLAGIRPSPVLRFARWRYRNIAGACGADAFGRIAERIARFFGTPQYIVGQKIVVIGWVILNAFAFAGRWGPYPFILLNLAFSLSLSLSLSLQAAYARR